MYGSSFCIVTRRPRDFSRRPSEDAVRPFPRELATPPVTKMCFVTTRSSSAVRLSRRNLTVARPARAAARRPRTAPECTARRVGARPAARRRGGVPWRCRASPRACAPARPRGPSPASTAASVKVAPSASRLVMPTCVVGPGRHLRQVGDHQHLVVGGQERPGPGPPRSPPSPPIPASTSSNTRVGGASVSTRRSASMRAGQLAARRHPGQRQRRAAGVGGQQVGHVVAGIVADLDLDHGLGHGQLDQVGLGGLGQRAARPVAGPGPPRPRPRPPAWPAPRPGGRRARRPGGHDPRAGASRAAASAWKAMTSASGVAVLAAQLVEQAPALLHLGQPRRDRPRSPRPWPGPRTATSASSASSPRRRATSSAKGARPSRAASARPARSTAPSSASSAARAAQRRLLVGQGVGQRVLERGQLLVLVGIGPVRPASISSTWKRSRSISRARARSSPPRLVQLALDRLQLLAGRGAAARGRSPPNRSSASRCDGRRQQGLVVVLAVQVDQPADRARPGSPRWPAGRRRRPATAPKPAPPAAGRPRAPSTTNRPSTTASVAPWRTIDGSARPPISSSIASTTSVLPAPVSPVTAVMPGPSTSESSAMTPRSVTASSVSTASSRTVHRTDVIGVVIGRSAGTWP